MEKILEILQSIRSDVDFENEKSLIDDGILDSFDIVSVVGELCDEFDITITVDDMEPENFNSVEAILALVENLHRADLSFWEEAQAIAALMESLHLTQQQTARLLCRSQPAVANKLRLLRLPAEACQILQQAGLTERHARALLRLSDEAERLRVIAIFVERGMNVAAAEEYIESLLCAESRAEEIRSKPPKSEQRHKLIIKDIRIFYNSIDHAVDIIKKSGIPVESTRKETDHGTLISILLPKAV